VDEKGATPARATRPLHTVSAVCTCGAILQLSGASKLRIDKPANPSVHTRASKQGQRERRECLVSGVFREKRNSSNSKDKLLEYEVIRRQRAYSNREEYNLVNESLESDDSDKSFEK